MTILSKIDPVLSASWQNHSFLTIDIDWVHDDILKDSIDLIEKYDVAATWFVTHDTPLLARLRENPKFELGIHPNFNFLLHHDTRNGKDADEVLDKLLAIVPEARSIRSHSTTQSSYLLDLFVQKGLSHECNSFIPAQSGMQLRPWQLYSGLIRIPYFWEDDVHCLYPENERYHIAELTAAPGLKVFDFHPIHIFMNTEHLDRYERTRQLQHAPDQLKLQRNVTVAGTRDHLIRLLKEISQVDNSPL